MNGGDATFPKESMLYDEAVHKTGALSDLEVPIDPTDRYLFAPGRAFDFNKFERDAAF